MARPVRRGALRHLRLRLPGLGRVRVSQRLPVSRRTARPWIIFSPGALTGPADYPELLDALTARGTVVLTLDYRWPALFRNEPAETSRAWRAAQRLRRRQLPARGLASGRLPATSAGGAARSAPPLRILAYSLGGWVLSAGFQRRADGQPLEIVLLGASSLHEPWRPPTSRQVRIRLLAGTEDGVVDPAGLQQLADAFHTRIEWLPGVNHFGILDERIGSPDFRARDRATELSARQCAERIARQVLRGR
ncbi:MAG: hypothetical protein LJE69_01465 [Thiohalocapsa sp.]|nr:hypothetical protein [Thiohalocapsa sp.]